ncbi:MAG: hypothetical protein AAGA36_00280 [Pseudomonadota bacterium]
MLKASLGGAFELTLNGDLVLSQRAETNRPVKFYWQPELDAEGETPSLLSAQVRNETPDTLTISGTAVTEVSANLYSVPVGVNSEGRTYMAFNPVGDTGQMTLLLTVTDGVQPYPVTIEPA